jgi:hypothetical protein
MSLRVGLQINPSHHTTDQDEKMVMVDLIYKIFNDHQLTG